MSIKTAVELCLKYYPITRNNDAALTLYCWHALGFSVGVDINRIEDMPSPETFTRHRRKFQEAGEYLASERVQLKREANREKYQKINEWWE